MPLKWRLAVCQNVEACGYNGWSKRTRKGLGGFTLQITLAYTSHCSTPHQQRRMYDQLNDTLLSHALCANDIYSNHSNHMPEMASVAVAHWP